MNCPYIVRLEDWRGLPVESGFTTRHFPVFLKSTADLLNPETQSLFVGAIHELPLRKFAFIRQVHGDRVLCLSDAGRFSRDGFYHSEGTDGLLTNIPGLALLVLSADCLSIFFHAPGWVGIAHAGWRGTRGGIASKAFGLLLEKSGCRPSAARIAFGPRICTRHYEVGEEFSNYFPLGGETPPLRRRGGKLYFDLASENKRQLIAAGALPKNITDSSVCTVCDSSDYYSFRKEKDAAGRMVSFIARKML